MFGFSRITPWVGRLAIANAVVLLLLQTLLTAPAVTGALAFDPAAPFARPWTYLTYAFVHADLWHLLFNMLGLYVFGTAVESRLGSRAFIGFWLFSAAGAALATAIVHPLFPIAPFVGASGAVLATAIVFALSWPDAELLVFPIPIPIRARTLALLLVAYNAIMAVVSRSGSGGVAYEAHLGGALMGWLFVRASALSGRGQIGSTRVPGVMNDPEERSWTPSSAGTRSGGDGGIIPSAGSAPARAPVERRRTEPRPDADRVEMDRVLDKISATGIASLTSTERQFLDAMSAKRKQGDAPH